VTDMFTGWHPRYLSEVEHEAQSYLANLCWGCLADGLRAEPVDHKDGCLVPLARAAEIAVAGTKDP